MVHRKAKSKVINSIFSATVEREYKTIYTSVRDQYLKVLGEKV